MTADGVQDDRLPGMDAAWAKKRVVRNSLDRAWAKIQRVSLQTDILRS